MTTATRTIEVLSRQEIDTNIVYQIENDRNEKYCVTLRKNGTAACIDSHDEQCKGTWSNNTCYHILHCTDLEATPYERVEIDADASVSAWIDSLDNTLSDRPVVEPSRRRYDAWTMRNQTLCCGHWWNGNVCLYGGHNLREVR